ncbi:MAG: YebC/PmpR family DNA-binding transcriptional regulator [Patescibacteria group bacterium]
MSGHSKWHNIQAKKGKMDSLKANAFTKIARLITVAAQQGGGDPEMNFSLRLAVEKAKAVNMPKDNIERAIKKGTGGGSAELSLHEVVYEGFGPGGVAVIVEALTENPNRTVSEVKNVFSRQGGTMGGSGSVQWQFVHSGVARLDSEQKKKIINFEDFELAMIDAGADEIIESEDVIEVRSAVVNLNKIIESVKNFGVVPTESGLEWIAKESIVLDDETGQKLNNLFEALDDLDDVKEVYTNAN